MSHLSTFKPCFLLSLPFLLHSPAVSPPGVSLPERHNDLIEILSFAPVSGAFDHRGEHDLPFSPHVLKYALAGALSAILQVHYSSSFLSLASF